MNTISFQGLNYKITDAELCVFVDVFFNLLFFSLWPFNLDVTLYLFLPVEHQASMSPSLARSAPSELNHWWSQLRFRLQNKKGWNEMLDETFLLYTKQ